MGREKREEFRAEPEAPREQAEMGVELWPSPRKETAPEAWQLLWLIPYGGPGEEGWGGGGCSLSRGLQQGISGASASVL